MQRLFAAIAFSGAMIILLALCAHAAVAQDVTIKSVDNYAGNSNVYTSRPNTTVTITHSDGERWTGTTDSEGKITIRAGYTLSKESLKIKLASENQSNMVEGIVVPDNVYDRQPFSFAVPQNAGSDVSVQTVSGVVVQSAPADKYGRVFLAAGLPAGAYLIAGASKDGGHTAVGRIEIGQRASDALDRPWEHPPQPIQILNVPRAVKLSDSLSVTGHGFNPNSAVMQFNLAGPAIYGNQDANGQTYTVGPDRIYAITRLTVLAATEDELKSAPVASLSPGLAELTVTNVATGQSTESRRVLLYHMQGHLERRQLKSGSDRTQLVVNTRPENLALKVQASVASGPVDFGGGLREAEAVTNHGQAVFVVHADRGAGPFQLAWTLANPAFAVDDSPSSPKEWVEEKAKDCQKGADSSTDNTSVAKDLKEEAKLDQATADKPGNWDKDGQPTDKKKFGKFLNEEIARLKKLLNQDGDGNAKDSIKKATSDAIEGGKAAGLKF
jgi:hypothetical protein